MQSLPRISAVVVALVTTLACGAQNCTTQAKLTSGVRETLAQTALTVANAIKDGNADQVKSLAASDIAANFGPTGYIVRTTSEALAGDTLRVTQLYQLDVNSRQPNDTTEADFSCPLTGSASETDFGISGLSRGLYAFAVVEASGPNPYLLAFLFKQEGNDWKLAGLYPHASTVAGHNGLWYWNAARAAMKANQPWLAWLEYGEADNLLRPANFVTSTHLDKLRSERGASAPPELSNGLGRATPYILKTSDGTEFPITALETEPSADGKQLELILHFQIDLFVKFRMDPLSDVAVARARNLAAAKAFLTAHPELRAAIAGVTVFTDTTNQPPFATLFSLSDLN